MKVKEIEAQLKADDPMTVTKQGDDGRVNLLALTESQLQEQVCGCNKTLP